jgi:uncharacterized membrane protein (DUF373 family)
MIDRSKLNMAVVFEKVRILIVKTIIVLMTLTVIFATLDLAWILIKDLISPPKLLLDVKDLKEIFGLFLLVLIGLELVESMQAYLANHVIHTEVEVILLIAIIAVARKIIIMDVDEMGIQTLLGIASIIIALAGGYYLLKRTRKDSANSSG